MRQALAITRACQGNDCLDAWDDFAVAVSLLPEMICRYAELLQDALQLVEPTGLAKCHDEPIERALLVERSMADIDVDEHAGRGRADTGVETADSGETTAEVKLVGGGRVHGKRLGRTDGGKAAGRLGVMVQKDVESLNHGQLGVVIGRHVRRRDVVDELRSGQHIGALERHRVHRGVLGGIVLVFLAIRDLHGLIGKLLTRYECRPKVGNDVISNTVELGRLKQEANNLRRLSLGSTGLDGHVVAIQNELRGDGKRDVVAPENDGLALGAVAGPCGKGSLELKAVEAEGSSARLDSVLCFGYCRVWST